MLLQIIFPLNKLKTGFKRLLNFLPKLKLYVPRLSVEELNLPYRPDGWTIKQVVHHCADSHMNSLIRFKLALTEDQPTIRPYFEDRWATLVDSLSDDITPAIGLLTHLHTKWVQVLRALTPEDLKRTFVHPEHGTVFTLEDTIGSYAWHCAHHSAHIRQALQYRGNF